MLPSKNFTVLTIILLVIVTFAFSSVNPTEFKKQVVTGQIIVKYKSDSRLLSQSSNTKKENFKEYAPQQRIAKVSPVSGLKSAEFNNTFKVNFQSGQDPRQVADQLSMHPEVEYAEPVYVHGLFETPNDLHYNGMKEVFQVINAPEAWTAAKGQGGDVVIAVIDGGTDWRHEDLRENIWINADEVPGNGIDDDNNGYVDDVNGWNFAAGSNDPSGLSYTPHNAQHGTHVAGIVGAVTNNGLGIASLSWNVKVMPINASYTMDNTIAYGFDGIKYAVDNGADIINLSWGRQGAFSAHEQAVIDYATRNGVLIVASAGNGGHDNLGDNNDETPTFPANYDNVLSVGATELNDTKARFSNYGISVDVFAPGVNVLSSGVDNDYIRKSGTSMASPMVAALAGLVKTAHPEWDGAQLAQQIKSTSTPIDDYNSLYAGQMGSGRINAYKAVTGKAIAVVQVTNKFFTVDGLSSNIRAGDDVELTVSLTSVFDTAENVRLTLESGSSEIQLENTNAQLDEIFTDSEKEVKFQFKVSDDVVDATIPFYLNIKTDVFSHKEVLQLEVSSRNYFSHNTGALETSVTARGRIGFDGSLMEAAGKGFTYKGENQIFEGGLIIGTSPEKVSSNVRGWDGFSQDDDFAPVENQNYAMGTGGLADQESYIVFDDSNAENPIGIKVVQQSYSYTNEKFNDFVILKYTFENTTDSTITNFHAGVFVDWELNGFDDYIRFDDDMKLGYAVNAVDGADRASGVIVLDDDNFSSFRAISNPLQVYDGFQKSEKWDFLTGGTESSSLDFDEVSTLTAAGPYTIHSGQVVEVSFAMVAGHSVEELKANAFAAKTKYNFQTLPVAFADFEANYVADKVELNWRTESETNNYGFEVQKNNNGTWEEIGFVKGNGTTVDANAYSFVDETVNFDNSNVEYRLKQIDYSGNFEYSSLATADVAVPFTTELVGNYPNPFNMHTKIQYTIAKEADVDLKIFNSLGQVVKTLVNRTHSSGKYTVAWDGTNETGQMVASGTYFSIMTVGNELYKNSLLLIK